MTDVGAVTEPTNVRFADSVADQADTSHASDMLFAAAMPKEEIGALAFLKV